MVPQRRSKRASVIAPDALNLKSTSEHVNLASIFDSYIHVSCIYFPLVIKIERRTPMSSSPDSEKPSEWQKGSSKFARSVSHICVLLSTCH